MAQYDGSIRINTKINTDGVKKGVSEIKSQLSSLSAYVKKAFSGVGNGIKTGISGISSAIKKFGTGIRQQVSRTDKDIGGFSGTVKKFGTAVASAFAVGKIAQFGKTMTELGSDLQEVQNVVDVTFTSMSENVDNFARKAAVSAGLSETMAKRYVGTFGAMAKSFGFTESEAYNMSTALTQLSGDVASFYNITQDEAYTKLKSVFTGETETLKDLGVVMTQNALDAYAMANGYGKTTSAMTEQEKVALRYRFVLQQLSAASGDFVRTSDSWANQIRILKLQFQSFMAAIGQGLINLLTPVIKALNVLMGKLVAAANTFKKFTEKITGKKAASGGTSAGIISSSGSIGELPEEYNNAASAADNLANSTENIADATKDAEEAAEGYLNPLDDINKIGEQEKDLGNLDFGINEPDIPVGDLGNFDLGEMAEEASDDVESVFSKFFEPLKKAWSREGKFVMDSWKYALGEVWKLLKDIGRDFLKVWNQPATIDMLADMLHILGDIGLIVGNIAGKFREAWNYNNTGLHILENIRDIAAIIVHNFRDLADYTVEWSKTLDFKPLLTSIETLTASLKRFADFVSGTLVDFAKYFILPLTSWTLSEQGLPRLFNILASFMNSVDWEGLRAALKSLYQALEPYAEEIGKGLLDFIESMKDESVDFFNFLPGAIQRAADALKAGDLAAAFYEFGSISGEAVKMAFNNIKHAIESINWGEIGTLIASFINGIDWMGVGQSFFGSIASAINGAIDLLYNFISTTDWRAIGTAFGTNLSNAWASIDWAQAGALVGEAFKAFFNFIATTIENIDWFAVGESVKSFLINIDWAGIAQAVFEVIGAALAAQYALIGNLIFSAISSAIEYIREKIEECGGNIALGILKGIVYALAGIGEWIVNNILIPFLNGFKKAFGIHSPSTVMEEQGKYIMEGLFNGISSLVGKVVSIFSDIKGKIVGKWEEIRKSTEEKWRNICTTVKGRLEELKANVRTGAENVKTNVQNAWDNIARKTSTTWQDIKGKLEGTWRNLKANASTAFSGIADSVKQAWSGLGDSTKRAWEGLATIIKKPINAIIGFANRLIEAVATMVNNVAKMLNSLHVDIPDWVPGIGGGKLGFNLPTWTPGHIPYLAQGTVVPPNREFMAVLGDNKKETEVVSPLSTIEQAVENAMRRNGGGQEITIKVPVYLDGKQITELVVKHGKIQQMSTGKNIFALG